MKSYKDRYGGSYKKYKEELSDFDSLEKLNNHQNDLLVKFVKKAFNHSKFYNGLYSEDDIISFKGVKDLSKLPIVNKELLIENKKFVNTVEKKDAIVFKTGGTTGKSFEVLCTKDDLQKRYAFLDNFREKLGYNLGEKTAWFSGKKLLNDKNVEKGHLWKYDFFHKVKYYSTFHCSGGNIKYILDDLIRYKPLYLIGFPSNMYDIAVYGLKNNIQFSKCVSAIFPTAETITDDMRAKIELFFQTKMYDQYASSEGAPFIFECKNGNLHLDKRSGVFEVLDENDNPSDFGRLIVTSFSTHATPLIRYDIGDQLKLSNNTQCQCGNVNPIVDKIMGRVSDFVYSPFTGKINLGNLSNSLKGVDGVRKFQITQNVIDEILISMEVDKSIYSSKDENVFLENLKDRLGDVMKINLSYVESIPKEKSGKFRFLKNNLSKKQRDDFQ